MTDKKGRGSPPVKGCSQTVECASGSGPGCDITELVGSLILGEPSPFPGLLNGDALALLSEQKAGFDRAIRLAEDGDEESAVREFLHTIVGIDVLCLLPDERRSVVLENADTLLPMLRTYYESPSLSRKQLKQLNVPTLLVTGEFSPRISRVAMK